MTAATAFVDVHHRPRPHGRGPARDRLRLVAGGTAPSTTVPPARRAVRLPAATYRRRRVAAGAGAGLVALVMVVALGQAGRVLGSPSLAAPGPGPSPTAFVVEPGDTLWDAAVAMAPDRDPRPVVHAWNRQRGGAPLRPGEVLRWPGT